MKKKLIIVAHPHIEQSVVNKCWIEKLKLYPEQFTVHELYQAYPDGKIDIAKEQKIIQEHNQIVLQFPIYWFNGTPLLKQWLDEVFTHGWAFGSGGEHLVGRKIGLAVSTGIMQEDYTKEGKYHYRLEEILRGFEITMNYVGADYQPIFAFYGTENDLSPKRVNQSAVDYITYLSNL